VFKLEAIQFDPPRPDGSRLKPYDDKLQSINILLMNVVEPVIYRDGDGTVFIILNAFDDDTVMTYENFEDTHPIKGAWGYRLCPHYVRGRIRTMTWMSAATHSTTERRSN
jgi:hypothetical protein